MALDPNTLLQQVEAAIEALLVGGHTSYSIGGRNVTKLDLATLFEQRRLLQVEVERSSGSGAIRLAKITRPLP